MQMNGNAFSDEHKNWTIRVQVVVLILLFTQKCNEMEHTDKKNLLGCYF